MAIEQTLMLVKPDAMERNLAGEIVKRYQEKGFKVVAMKMVKVSRAFAAKHYRPANEEWVTNLGHKTLQAVRDSGKPGDAMKVFKSEDPAVIGKKILDWTIKNLTRTPIIAFVLEGENAVAEIRKITGYTDPARSEKGTVRGDLGQDSIVQANLEGRPVKNLVHASGTVDEAKLEIALWFKPKQVWGADRN
jgi:nucleoside-diphosphate kinase